VAVSPDSSIEIVKPEWNVAGHVQAAATARFGGVSTFGYKSLNLATHVGDDWRRVERNRQRLVTALDLPQAPRWIDQVHSPDIVCADDVPVENTREAEGRVVADGTWTDRPGIVCAVLTADCLPVLLCDAAGTRVAAVHAGWRGLSSGILDRATDVFCSAGIPAVHIKVWLGPAIGPAAYEVDAAVRDAFLQREPACRDSFVESRPGHWLFNLYSAARTLLRVRDVTDISGGDWCTFSDDRFYSYRRGVPCGRQASLVWLDEPDNK